MKFLQIAILFLTLISTACVAQRNAVEIKSAVRGNTGFRGRALPEEMDKPNVGKDFYSLELTIKKSCTIALGSLKVNVDGGQIQLQPTFDGGLKKRRFKAGEVVQVRAERPDNLAVGKLTVDGEGTLSMIIGNRRASFSIENFTLILPQ